MVQLLPPTLRVNLSPHVLIGLVPVRNCSIVKAEFSLSGCWSKSSSETRGFVFFFEFSVDFYCLFFLRKTARKQSTKKSTAETKYQIPREISGKGFPWQTGNSNWKLGNRKCALTSTLAWGVSRWFQDVTNCQSVWCGPFPIANPKSRWKRNSLAKSCHSGLALSSIK